MVPPVPANAPAFVKDVLGMMIANRGDDLPVSALPCDGTFPTGTTQYEKRSIAQDIPIWDPKICIQCGLCSLGCPHATIRMKAFDPALLAKAPEGFKSTDYKGKEFPGWKFVVQVFPDDCTGCGLCVDVCPAKDKERVKHKAIDMEPKLPHLEQRAGEPRLLPRRFPTSIARRSSPTRSRARSSCCRCLSSPGPAPAAAKRPTSSCSRSSSATGC